MKLLTMIKYDLIKFSREKIALLFSFLMPIIFVIVFSNIGSGNKSQIPIGIVNLDSGTEASNLISELKQEKAINILIETDQNKLYKDVKNSDIEVGFIIPSNYSELFKNSQAATLTVVKLPSSQDYVVLEGIVNTCYSNLLVEKAAIDFASENLNNQSLQTRQEIVNTINNKISNDLKIRSSNFVVSETNTLPQTFKFNSSSVALGFIIFFVMFNVVFSSGQILEEKKNNTWGRLLITPTSLTKIMIGKVLTAFVRGWIQIIILMGLGLTVAHLNFGNNWLNCMVVLSVYLLCVTGLGMFLATIVKTNSQLGAISSIVIVCTSMLSGCYWPLEIVPNFMQQIAKIFPQYWALKSLNGLAAGDVSSGTVGIPILMLSILGVVFFIFAWSSGKLLNSQKI